MATFTLTDTREDESLTFEFDTDAATLDQSENFYKLELLNDRDHLLAEFNRQQDIETSWNCPGYWLD